MLKRLCKLACVLGIPALAAGPVYGEGTPAEEGTAKTAVQTTPSDAPPVKEGHSAVDFYTVPESANWDSSRLSATLVPYPAATAERLPTLFELGDPFLGQGPIRPGVKTPFGQMLQPSFLLFGSMRTALQTFRKDGEETSEWANRLDLNGNLHLSGTERILISLRPLDSERGDYTGYDFEPDSSDGWREDFNARVTKLFFEGDLGEIFPGLDPSDSHTYDIGFSVGRQRLMVQDGILMNDIIDSVGLTRNSLVFDGVSNLRITGIYGANHVTRGNNDPLFHEPTDSANVFGILTEADTALNNTVALDFIGVRDEHNRSAWYAGASSTQRFGTLNTTFRVNASIPDGQASPNVGRGVLLVSQLSRTLFHTDNVLYFNTFLDIGNFTSVARSPDQGTPIASLGVLYGPVGMGRYGVPLGLPIEDTIGTALGYQMFLDGISSQLILELGARTSTQSERDEGQIGFGARYQKSIGDRHVLRLDSFVAGQEEEGFFYGLRTEWMVKF